MRKLIQVLPEEGKNWREQNFLTNNDENVMEIGRESIEIG